MNKKLRRLRWGMKKQMIRNIFTVTAFFCSLLLVLSLFDECTYLGIFPAVFEPEKCKKTDIVKEKLNMTFFVTDYAPLNAKINLVGFDTQNLANDSLGASGVQPYHPPFGNDLTDNITELPFYREFSERKLSAERACTNAVTISPLKKIVTGTLVETQEPDAYINMPPPPLKRKSRSRTRNAQELLRVLQQRDLRLSQRSKFYQSAVAVKKNRVIYFHRIIQSRYGPAHNKVVEIKWCPIFKAASTPWLAVFTKLSKGLTNITEAQIKRGKLNFMELARTYRLLTPRIYDKNVHVTKYSMVIVRHPFKRLLSAYRDKIERVKGRLFYYNKYSTKIISKFRKPSPQGTAVRKSKNTNLALKVPTFEEFVRYVLSTDARKLDEHWRPMFLDCNPCHHMFDFILKVETLDRDKQKVFQQLQLVPPDPQYKEVDDVWVRWNNPSGINSPRRNESFYFSQLTVRDIENLYSLYEPDFRIFDYSPELYLKMGRVNSETTTRPT